MDSDQFEKILKPELQEIGKYAAVRSRKILSLCRNFFEDMVQRVFLFWLENYKCVKMFPDGNPNWYYVHLRSFGIAFGECCKNLNPRAVEFDETISLVEDNLIDLKKKPRKKKSDSPNSGGHSSIPGAEQLEQRIHLKTKQFLDRLSIALAQVEDAVRKGRGIRTFYREISRLPEKSKEVFLLMLEDLSEADVARRLGLSRAAITQRFNKGKAALLANPVVRSLLEEYD